MWQSGLLQLFAKQPDLKGPRGSNPLTSAVNVFAINNFFQWELFVVRADKRKFHYIYKITRNDSTKYYLGMHSTDNLEDGYFGSGKRLWYSINKYGKENHTKEILEFCNSREQLRIREKEVIGELYRLDENCMNLQPGGGGGFCSEEQQRSFSLAGNEGLRKKLAEDSSFREFVSLTHRELSLKAHQEGRMKPWSDAARTIACKAAQSPEARAKRIQSFRENNHQQGEKNSQFGKQWIYNDSLKICKRINKDELIPDGWNKGRKMKF